jgi:hypothetical protein
MKSPSQPRTERGAREKRWSPSTARLEAGFGGLDSTTLELGSALIGGVAADFNCFGLCSKFHSTQVGQTDENRAL